MTTALYRRYRSAQFGDLIGQDQIGSTLRNQVRSGQVAHAYLFTGIRGTGKTSTARILARAINCLKSADGEPCNECVACLEILGGGAIDVLEIDAASNRGIDEIRDLREKVNYLPASLTRKVYIIDEAHMLTGAAWNAFLKTLEEPPAHVVFILATTEPHDIPDTIRSRVQRYDFRRVATGGIAAHLGRIATAEGVDVASDALELLATAAQGSVRDGLSLLDQALTSGVTPLDVDAVRRALGLADPAAVRGLLEAVAAGEAGQALRGAAAAFDAGADARQLIREIARLVRAAALAAVGYIEGAELSSEDRVVCERLGQTVPARVWVDALELLSTTERELRQPVDARLQVEHCLLRLARPTVDASAPVDDLVAALTRRVERLEAGAVATPVATAPNHSMVAPAAPPQVAVVPAPASIVPAPAAIVPTPVAVTPPQAAPVVVTAPADTRTGSEDEPATAATVAAALRAHETRPSAPAPATPAPAIPAPSPVANTASPQPVSVLETSPVAPTPSAPPSTSGTASPEDVAAWVALWTPLVDAVNRRDSMLAGVLRDCRPLDAAPGRLVVGAPYSFHLDRINEPTKLAVLIESVAEVGPGVNDVSAAFCGDDKPVAQKSAGGQSEVTKAALDAFKGSRITSSRLRDER